MAVVRTFINDAEAEIAASAIEAAGIEVTIHRDAAGGLQPNLDMYGIQLVVRLQLIGKRRDARLGARR